MDNKKSSEVDAWKEIVAKKISYADIEEILKCPVCLDEPKRGNVYQCQNGHWVCTHCYRELQKGHNAEEEQAEYNTLRKTGTKCPLCRKPLNTRNNTAESLLKHMFRNIPIKCRHATEGCPYQQQKEGIEIHEIYDCPFRPQSCPGSQFGKCNFKGSTLKLLEHIQENDCTKLKKINTDVFNRFGLSDNDTISLNNGYTELSWNETKQVQPTIIWTEPQIDIESSNLMAYLSIQQTGEGDWHITPRAIGPRRLQDQFYAEVTIRGKASVGDKKIQVEHIYRGPLTDNNDQPHINVIDPNTLILTSENVERIEELPSFFDYTFRIAKSTHI